VTGAGDISLSNDASISIVTNQDVVAGPGSISINRDRGPLRHPHRGQQRQQPAPTSGAVDSTGGPVTLTAGRDVLVGDTATGFGDVVGVGVTLSAGRHVVIDQQSDVLSTGAVTVTAGTAGLGDVSILKNGGTGASIITGGGNIVITAGAGGLVTLDSDADLAGGPTIDMTFNGAAGGDLTINADRLDLTANDSIRAGVGAVTLQQVTAAQAIDLGSAVRYTNRPRWSCPTPSWTASRRDSCGSADPANAGNVTVSRPHQSRRDHHPPRPHGGGASSAATPARTSR